MLCIAKRYTGLKTNPQNITIMKWATIQEEKRFQQSTEQRPVVRLFQHAFGICMLCGKERKRLRITVPCILE